MTGRVGVLLVAAVLAAVPARRSLPATTDACEDSFDRWGKRLRGCDVPVPAESQEVVIEESADPLLAIDGSGNLLVFIELEGVVRDPDTMRWPEGLFSERCRSSIRAGGELGARFVVCLKDDALSSWRRGSE